MVRTAYGYLPYGLEDKTWPPVRFENTCNKISTFEEKLKTPSSIFMYKFQHEGDKTVKELIHAYTTTPISNNDGHLKQRGRTKKNCGHFIEKVDIGRDGRDV